MQDIHDRLASYGVAFEGEQGAYIPTDGERTLAELQAEGGRIVRVRWIGGEYASSDCGMFDDGDTIVDACAWHALKEDAFSAWLQARDAGKAPADFDEVHWLQVVAREDEFEAANGYMYDYAWSHILVSFAFDGDIPF